MPTITFDQIGNTQPTYTEKGFTFRPAGDTFDIGGRFQTIFVDANTSQPSTSLVRMTADNGELFSVASLSINQLFSQGGGTTVTFVGQKFDGSSISQTFKTDTDGNTAETVNLSGFTSLTLFQFNYGDDIAGSTIDNIVIATPAFTVSNANAAEGNTGTNPLAFTITRSGPSDVATTLYARPISGTATAGEDFVGAVVPVSFAAGQTSATVAIGIIGDTTVEQTESFTLNLYGDSALTMLRSSATGTIVNDDTPANQVNGTQGNDLIYATGNGPSTLIGFDGNDTYVIRNPNDAIREFEGGGNDIVYSSISYTLNPDAVVESLSTQTNAGTESINLIGNSYAQFMVGNFGNNVINGNGGADTLVGLKGDDIYSVADATAIVREARGEGNDTVFAQVSYTLSAGAEVETLSTASQRDTGALNLTGNEYAQQVVGNFGANVLDGGAGADTLIGLAGADTFRFSTALGNGNVDTIADFESGVDRIALSSSVFTGMGTGTLTASGFVIGTAATTADQHIIYNQTTGQLFFDADGSGAGAAVLFATVVPGTVLTANMIAVV